MNRFKQHIILLFFVSLCACGPLVEGVSQAAQEINKTELSLRANEGLFYYKEKPFSGTALTYLANGTLVESERFVNGKRHGLLKKWYPDGTQSYQAHYQDGLLHGAGNSWWPNGQMRTASNYVDGVTHGKQKQWYRSGVIFKEINLMQGKEQGLQKAWRENGKIYNNYEAKNGRIFGLKRSKLCFELSEEEVQYAD